MISLNERNPQRERALASRAALPNAQPEVCERLPGRRLAVAFKVAHKKEH